MPEKRRVNLSLNLSAPHQREAWGIIRAIPAGQRTDAVCRMICKGYKRDALLEEIRAVIREELHSVEFIVTTGEKRYKGHRQRKVQTEGFFSRNASAKPKTIQWD